MDTNQQVLNRARGQVVPEQTHFEGKNKMHQQQIIGSAAFSLFSVFEVVHVFNPERNELINRTPNQTKND
jgi:hypothetical protein